MQTHLRDEYVMFTFTLKSVQLSHLSPGTRTPYRATYIDTPVFPISTKSVGYIF